MAPLELKHIQGNTWIIPGSVNIGIYKEEDGVVLIDSGNDKEAGRQIGKLLKNRGWDLKLILNTHSNADHIGGNAFLQKQTGCLIGAPSTEASFIANPQLEPSLLWGGYPFKELENKFLKAKPSRVDRIISEPGPIEETSITAQSLPGHYLNMFGFQTVDNVFFIADSLFSENILKKYHIIYIYDLKSFFETLKIIENSETDWFVPSHSPPDTDMKKLAEKNRAKSLEILDLINRLCAAPLTTEMIVQKVCEHYGIELNFNQYVLITSTIKAYLSYMRTEGTTFPILKENLLYWQAST